MNCPICSASAEPDSAAWRALALADAPRQYTIMRCSGCELRWLDPFPTPADYQALYDPDYYEVPQRMRLSYAEERKELRACYDSITRQFKQFGIFSGLLDIGCGTGDFLAAAADGGIKGEGVEPSEYAARVATDRGHDVWHGSIEDLPAEPASISAVHCSHVLEHVPDAHGFLERVRLLLEPGAPVYLEVPLQFDGFLDKLQTLRGKHREFSVHSIHHHYFFTPRALTRLLRQYDFEVISLTTFLPCRRAMRPVGPRKWGIQAVLWLADRLAQAGDVISVWARLGR